MRWLNRIPTRMLHSYVLTSALGLMIIMTAWIMNLPEPLPPEPTAVTPPSVTYTPTTQYPIKKRQMTREETEVYTLEKELELYATCVETKSTEWPCDRFKNIERLTEVITEE